MSPEIQDFLAYLKRSNLKEKAYFGIFQYGGGSDESFIKANKEGLLQFAHELLEAYETIEANLKQAEKGNNNTYAFDHDADWVDGDSHTFIQYLEFTQEARKAVIPEAVTSTLTKKLTPIGCIAIVIALAACTLIGFGTVMKWIFT